MPFTDLPNGGCRRAKRCCLSIVVARLPWSASPRRVAMAAQLKSTERLVWGSTTRLDLLGQHALWGFSPAVDVLTPLPGSVDREGSEVIRVLLASPGDLLGFLRTVARRREGPGKVGREVTFLLHEPKIDLIARHLVLLRVAFDWELPLRQRAAVFLELFGNALIQERTETYLGRLAKELGGIASDDECGLSDVVDASRLRFRDRDLLAQAFESWAPSAPALPMADLWDRRVRAALGKRYDHKDATFDWDYRKGLDEAGADLVHLKQYRHWRATGVAFEFGDQTYERPNRTLGTFVDGFLRHGKDKGAKREVRGYWGDMAVGPFLGLGLDVDDGPFVEDLLDIRDKGTGTQQRRHNATEVAVYNLISYLWAIETGERYAMSQPNEIFSGLGAASARDALAHAEAIVESLDGVTLVPVTGDLDAALAKLPPNSLDAAYFSVNSAAALGSPKLKAALKPKATVVAEKAKFVVPLTNQEKQAFDDKVLELAATTGLAKASATHTAVRFDHTNDAGAPAPPAAE